MKTFTLLSLAAPAFINAQATCSPGFFPGNDTVIFTTPYTYSQVLSIIGSFRNITWSGTPYANVTLNGTDNTVGTARTYDLAGAHVIETITTYSSPPDGPYEEIHTLDLLTVPSANVSLYAGYDGTSVVSTCDGKASTFNFTAVFCATNVTVATGLLHTLHGGDAQTVGVFLGGQNFTSCAALEDGSNATATGSAGAPQVTGSGAAGKGVSMAGGLLLVGGLLLGCVM